MTAEVWIHQSLAKRGRRRRFAPLSTTGSATRSVAIVARRHIRGGCAGRSPPKNLFSGVCRQGPKAVVMEASWAATQAAEVLEDEGWAMEA